MPELHHGRGQSAIESAQNDHATAVQSMIANKEAVRPLLRWMIMRHCDKPTVTIIEFDEIGYTTVYPYVPL